MLVFGSIRNLPRDSNFVVYNFTSTIETIPRLDLLPPRELVVSDEKEFDYLFMQYIMNDNNHFNAMMQIMMSLYIGDNVFIAISDISDPYIMNLNESLIKFIQQRYGYNAYKINTIEDLEYIDPTDGEFSFDGIYNFDSDRNRYVQNIEEARIAKGGRVETGESIPGY